jgi:hypothetical protein
MSSRETQMGSRTIIHVEDHQMIVIEDPRADEATTTMMMTAESSTSDNTQHKKFTFDYAYSSDSTQLQVYNDVARPLVDQAFQGYNGRDDEISVTSHDSLTTSVSVGTIFAYGQTGSGKTHTMMGSSSDHGIIPQMNADLFE